MTKSEKEIEHRRAIERKSVAKRNQQAREIKARLMRMLGSRCVWPNCGTTIDLTFDHPKGRTYDIAHLTPLDKYRRYEQDYRAGNLRLLCNRHNAMDGLQRTLRGIKPKYQKCDCKYCERKAKSKGKFWWGFFA